MKGLSNDMCLRTFILPYGCVEGNGFLGDGFKKIELEKDMHFPHGKIKCGGIVISKLI